MGWGRGETGRRLNPIFTAGTELRAASVKGASGRARRHGAPGTALPLLGAGRLEADTGSGIQNRFSPNTEEGLWGRTALCCPSHCHAITNQALIVWPTPLIRMMLSFPPPPTVPKPPIL